MARLNAVTAALPHLLEIPDTGVNTNYPVSFDRFTDPRADFFAALHARIPFWKVIGTITNTATWNDGDDKELVLECTLAAGPNDINNTDYRDIPYTPLSDQTLPNTGLEPSEKYLAYPVRLVFPQFPFSFTGQAELFVNGVLADTLDLDVTLTVEAFVESGSPSIQVGDIIYIGLSLSITVAVLGAISIPVLAWPDATDERGDVVSRITTGASQYYQNAEDVSFVWPHGSTGESQTAEVTMLKPNDSLATTSSGFSRVTTCDIAITPLNCLVYGLDPDNPQEYSTMNPLYNGATGAPLNV